MTEPTRWTDEDVETLLTDFFAAEMPAELRRPPAVRAGETPRPTQVAARDATAPTRVVGVAAVAVCLLVAGILFWRPDAPPEGPAPRVVTPDRDEPRPADDAPEPQPVPIVVEERSAPVDVERFDSEHGPVELRHNRITTDVVVPDPESGDGIELEFPALEIEVFPIEDSPSEPNGNDDANRDGRPAGSPPGLPESRENGDSREDEPR